MVSAITSNLTVCSIVCSGSQHQSCTLLTLCEENHQRLVDSPHKGSVIWKVFPHHYVGMQLSKECKSWITLWWHHNGHDGVSNHHPPNCLLSHLSRRRSKKTSKLIVTGLCGGIHRWPVNSSHKWPVTQKMLPFDDAIMWTSEINKVTVKGFHHKGDYKQWHWIQMNGCYTSH